MNTTEFWDRVDAVNAGMIETGDGARWVPMSHIAERDARTLWFITADGTVTADEAAAGPIECNYILADNGKGLFACLTGTLRMSNDRDKLEQLWNTVADSWFDKGIDDPDVRLLSLSIDGGEVWLTPTSGIRFVFDIARAQITGDSPDMGEHFTF
jgi:general stress protein 26